MKIKTASEAFQNLVDVIAERNDNGLWKELQREFAIKLIKLELNERDHDWEFAGYLDEKHGTVNVAGLEFETSTVLRRVDQTLFETARDAWLAQNTVEVGACSYYADQIEQLTHEVCRMTDRQFLDTIVGLVFSKNWVVAIPKKEESKNAQATN